MSDHVAKEGQLVSFCECNDCKLFKSRIRTGFWSGTTITGPAKTVKEMTDLRFKSELLYSLERIADALEELAY